MIPACIAYRLIGYRNCSFTALDVRQRV